MLRNPREGVTRLRWLIPSSTLAPSLGTQIERRRVMRKMNQRDYAVEAICNILHLVKDELSAPNLESVKAEILEPVMHRFAREIEEEV